MKSQQPTSTYLSNATYLFQRTGWADVGHNNPDVKETVAIDALAASGITLKDMHTVS